MKNQNSFITCIFRRVIAFRKLLHLCYCTVNLQLKSTANLQLQHQMKSIMDSHRCQEPCHLLCCWLKKCKVVNDRGGAHPLRMQVINSFKSATVYFYVTYEKCCLTSLCMICCCRFEQQNQSKHICMQYALLVI